MEFEEAHNNLCAIRLLYRLLEDNSIISSNSENVVETARVLLKSLLDVAVEIVFETHLKITTAKQASVKGENLCGPSEEKDMMHQNLVKMTNQSNEEGTLPNIESDNHENGDHVKESLPMLGESNEDSNIPLGNDISEAECNSSAVRLVESLQQKDDFSGDLVNAIKRIESRILAFQLCSNSMDFTKNGSCRHPLHKASNLGSSETQIKDRAKGSHLCCRKSLLKRDSLVNQKTDKSSCKGENLISPNAFEKPFITRNELLSQNGFHANAESVKRFYILKHVGTQMVLGEEDLRREGEARIQPLAQNVSMIDRANSLNRLVGGDANLKSQASECIQGLRVPLNQNDLTKKKPSMFACQPNRESLVRSNPLVLSKTYQNQKVRKCESSYTHKLVKSTPGRREKPLSHQIVIKPTLLDQRSSEIKVNSYQHNWSVLDRRGTHKTGHVEPRKTNGQQQSHEPEASSSTPDTSSQWTSQQSSAYSSNSDNEESFLAVGTQGPTSGWITNAAYEGSSKESSNSTQGHTPRWIVNAAYEGRSEESSNSCLYKNDTPSHRVGSLKSYRHNHGRSPKKTNGGLKKLKNKLGLIFHHHHHHHHHANGHGHSMWNNLQHVFHHKNKHGVLTNKKVEKTRAGAITRVMPRSNQVGQFHRFVEGIVSHIRHSKDPKPSKHSRVRGTRNTPHGHGRKKLHWWKILQHHRRVKLKNRRRVKMGFISQKPLKN